MSLYFEWRKPCGCRVPCDCNVKPKRIEPNYYFNQTDDMLVVSEDTPAKAIELEVTTTSPYVLVKLDSMIETYILTESEPEYSFIVEYSLFRESNPLTSESFAMINQIGQAEVEKTIMNTAKITWTDTLPVPGTYIYTLEVNHISLPDQHIASVEVQDRSLTAIVFPMSAEQKNSLS